MPRLCGRLIIETKKGIKYSFTIDAQGQNELQPNKFKRRQVSRQEKQFLFKTYTLLQPRKPSDIAEIISELYRGENREIQDFLQAKDKEWKIPSKPIYITKYDIYQYIYNNFVRHNKKKRKSY